MARKLDNSEGEVRFNARPQFNVSEARAEGEDGMTATGRAMVFNEETQIGDWFIEKFSPGAFTRSLTEHDQHCLLDHDWGRVMGRKKSGTLRLTEDNTGLNLECDLPDNNQGRDTSVSLARGDISGLSVRFRAVVEEWDESGDLPIRTVKEAELIEVSIVANPQYEATDVALRAHQTTKKKHNFSNAQRRMRMNQAQRERRI